MQAGFLKPARVMNLWASVAVTMLSSPDGHLGLLEPSATLSPPALVRMSPTISERVSETELLQRWLLNLAVVSPSPASPRRPSAVVCFLTVFPERRGVSLRLLGHF